MTLNETSVMFWLLGELEKVQLTGSDHHHTRIHFHTGLTPQLPITNEEMTL